MSKTTQEPEYYTLEPIDRIGAVYNVIFGVRSYGKTYALIDKFLTEYWQHRKKKELWQTAYLRRYDDAITPKFAGTVMDTMVCNGYGKNRIAEITDGEFDNAVYKAGAWTLCKLNPETGLLKKDANPFMLGFAMNTWDKMKGGSYPYVQNIWLEEFVEVSTKPYLKNEWSIFQNIVSTIARRRDVRIWLTGNTINIYCPYFKYMGLKNVKKMKPGQIDVYSIGKTDRKIAVEMTADTAKYKQSKRNNSYLFAFEDNEIKSITNSTWEIGSYPLVEDEIKQSDIVGRFWVEFDDELYCCDLVANDDAYIYAHANNDPLIVPDDTELYYTQGYSTKQNYRRRFDRPYTDAERIIWNMIRLDKIVYDNNATGNAIEQFIKVQQKTLLGVGI